MVKRTSDMFLSGVCRSTATLSHQKEPGVERQVKGGCRPFRDTRMRAESSQEEEKENCKAPHMMSGRKLWVP